MTTDTFTCVRVEGSILPTDLLQRVAAGDVRLDGLRVQDYGLDGEKVSEAANHAWTRLSAAWEVFKTARERLAPTDSGYKVTVDRWLLPVWKVLGYGTLDPAKPFVIDEKTYPVSHVRHHSPFHLVGFRQDLDKRVETDGKQFSPHGLVQEFLNRSHDHLWGFVSNGLKLRILRDNIRLTRQAFVEFDLQAMFDGKQYADFALLWRLCHESRINAEKPEQCWLERWSKIAAEQGLRALDQLRTGVENAVKALGRGFLACPANAELKAALKHNRLTPLEYYRQLLRVVYRFLFLFVAEDRELLCDPSATDIAKDRYTNYYSAARLRRIAERLRGSPHTDLFEGLSLVLDKLGTTGCTDLALHAFGGLFNPARTPNLTGCRLTNSDLLEAVRALSVISDGKARRSVDYRNLGAEELGSVYESLLELQPRFDPDAITFTLESASGNERKTTGSYYTPTSLITCLLDSALDPVLAEAAGKTNPEEAILALKVCDPACGSGHFLIAAAHRVAKKLASVRTLEDEPAPAAVRHALRDVIGRCIYGVDINPMAVELCQVGLWMEALEPGKPLSFLDHHIQCGNSLLGTTPALLAKGIPDEAFEPIEGDEKKWCAALKRQNKDERRGQEGLFDDDPSREFSGSLPEAMARLEGLPDDTVDLIREKERQYAELKSDAAYRTSGRFLADAWSAAFVWKKIKDSGLQPITHARFHKIEKSPLDIGRQEFVEVRRLVEQYQFFHWHIAFPRVFRHPAKNEVPDNELTGWCGGFDVVIGNPPWEHTELKEIEWFAAHGRADIAGARTAAIRGKLIRELETKDSELYRAFLEDRRHAEGESHQVRNSSGIDAESGRRWGMYPLCGRGRINTYAIFAELNRNLINPTGRVGCIVPTGIATDDTTKVFFQDIVERRSLESYFGFKNERFLFPKPVEHTVTYGLLTLLGSARAATAMEFCWNVWTVEEMRDPVRRVILTADDLKQISPNTGNCPVFRTSRDAELTKAIYRRVPVLLKEGPPEVNLWGVSFKQGLFNMASDSGLFRTASDLEADGWRLDGNIFRKGSAEYLPLYEAKLLHQFDHRWATYSGTDSRDVTVDEKTDPTFVVLPRYWVPANAVTERLKDRWDRAWLFGWRDVCRNTDSRTMISAVIPRKGVGDKFLLMFPDAAVPEIVGLIANYATFVFDYVTRQKLGGTALKYFVTKQLPVLPPDTYAQPCQWDPSLSLADWIAPRVLELTYTTEELASFAQDCGFTGDPFFWDDARRAVIRAELDAAFFHLYGISEVDADHILETFPLVKARDEERFGTCRTKEMILRCYQEMQEAISSQTMFTSQLDPMPGVPMRKDLFGYPAVAPRRDRVIQAFVDTRRDGKGVWSSELVVCSNHHRQRYLAEVGRTVPGITEEDANRELWNARRSGQLAHLPKSTAYSPDPKLRRYEFVVEWAYRHIIEQVQEETGQRKASTLERILCIPEWRQRFDDLIGELMKKAEVQFSDLDYRWTAMTLRKRAGEKGEATPSLFDQAIAASQAEARLPARPGVYLIRSDDSRVFTGWADNLQYQAHYLLETGGGSLVPSRLLAGRSPVKTIFYQEVETGTLDSQLHDLWRGNRRAATLPLLNLFA
ncbi:Eco57I restriction-modification methylase domain-containing protein [Limnoglobus roseus]|uniref:site-specific DNA-methyltransferase (adenine-specific) n=1 Tax=Limnoglobus roseus TaxID=2598579 RepID=A0A5C1A8J2_9BACT|nr:N-6 DNA methylase [Limnoglobus roseus]QEL14825.1 BREX-2 system adenine-specific DNA-methyltransferase PglX [Limnoglobus roseus]